jgi:protein SCO1/2
MMRRAVLLAVLLLAACRHESNLPKLFPLPDAHLMNDAGKPVRIGELKGYVTVYDFIFTNCAGSCPMMTRSMQLARKKVAGDAKVRFVSISVDPARDTPAVLHDYATKVRGNDASWMFLTGTRDEIVNLSVNGFKLAAGDKTMNGSEPLLHSAKFAVVDKKGVVRAYISSLQDDAPEKVRDTVHDLLRED